MPYIKLRKRKRIDSSIDELISQILGDDEGFDWKPEYEGIINYTVSRICNEVLIGDEPRYSKINTVLGVLEAVKLEFYRRLASPYEDKAIEKDGDLECYQ